MYAVPALERALSRNDWEAIATHLDSAFYRLLIAEPSVLERVFDAASASWLEGDPRSANFCAILRAVQARGQVVDPTAFQRFEDWVTSQPRPSLRDQLVLASEKLREMLTRGWYSGASRLADDVMDEIRHAPHDIDGLDDVAPVVVRVCGMAKFLDGALDSAAACFSEAVRWSSDPQPHPMAPFAKEHLALVHALEERYAAAAALIDGEPPQRSLPGTVGYLYEPAGLLARVLIATASVDVDEAHRLLDQADASTSSGHYGWVLQHARAKLSLLGGQYWTAIHDITTYLVEESHRTHPSTFAGSMLRADLNALYQAAGDLPAAEQILAHPSLPVSGRWIIVCRARQALIRGRPYDAVRMLRQPSGEPDTAMPAHGSPSGAVLYAAAELAASGQISPHLLEHAASSVNHHQAFDALAHASPMLEKALGPRVDIGQGMVPMPWTYLDRVKLTHREREVLQALREHPTVALVAAALHVSPNTAKSHVRSLYRKLGAHTRDEALWLGNDEGA
ncbi:hypothetical protein ITJ44_15625 [Clavibacter sp. VKM Ac-2873]|uniref:helix-turn-helix transcriptional regulator n=1 Tax=Clavibacter sp. VKM Ac-2873 TaxID=2783813 RepID=UPI00188A02D4|nr:helix-turn-helix transcriptional regulator [Clavibacter sp. VKM Ac-2873]MBF4619505.1 hypothetical protein [Clavibacter sp. VKM Ac-2873]